MTTKMPNYLCAGPNPVGSQSNANFGKITATVGSATATAVGTTAGVVGGGPRVIQFSLRLEF